MQKTLIATAICCSLLLVGCAQLPANQTVHQQRLDDSVVDYIVAVNRATQRNGIVVQWVNPPKQKQKPD